MSTKRETKKLRGIALVSIVFALVVSLTSASPVDAAQGTGWADVTVNIKENAGWKTTSLYFNPPNHSRYRCPDSKTSFFFRFTYNVYNGNLTVKNMRLTNGASRTDPISAGSFSSTLGGYSRTRTKTPMVRPGRRDYVRTQLTSTRRATLTGQHRNGGSTYIRFNVSASNGGRACGPDVIIRLK